jgi:acyl carrier protein
MGLDGWGSAVGHTDLTDLVTTNVATVLGVAPDSLAPATDLSVEYAIDSLELMEIGARIERALGIRLRVDDLAEFRTIEQGVAHLVGLLDVKA